MHGLTSFILIFWSFFFFLSELPKHLILVVSPNSNAFSLNTEFCPPVAVHMDSELQSNYDHLRLQLSKWIYFSSPTTTYDPKTAFSCIVRAIEKKKVLSVNSFHLPQISTYWAHSTINIFSIYYICGFDTCWSRNKIVYISNLYSAHCNCVRVCVCGWVCGCVPSIP